NYKNAPPSVREFWLSTAAFADRPYLVYGDETLSYAQTHAKADAVAAWLVANGVKPGDRVAVAMRNFPEWMVIYWACVSVGVAVVGMNAWWTTDEMAYALGDSAPKVLFLDDERLVRVQARPEMAAGIKLVGVRLAASHPGITPWDDVIAAGGAMPDVAVDPEADACIFYTSGTTGNPKGAQLTHRGCVANLFNLMYAGASTARAMHLATGIEPPAEAAVPVTLITTPLFHVTANNCGAYATTAAGGKLVMMYRWEAGEALKLIERERVSSMSGVPVMARELINHPDFLTSDTSSLVALAGGGAQVPPDLVLKIDAKVSTARPGTGYARVLERIAAELDRPLSIADLSAMVGTSPLRFLREFTRLTGMTPHAWITETRLQAARAMMRGLDLPLTQIALDCGFNHQSHMGHVFRQHLGLTPGQYRQHHGLKQT
ncbi:MAG TPA: AMP-binding protein, partial [Polymorphobacter sp.]|nr:AMP-binding protein [Polymorphobacter sp.]